jgi:hypothetical protein
MMRVCPYTLPVASLPVWIASWVHDCCGIPRHVDERVELRLTFDGEMVAADGPEVIRLLEDGEVSIVGTVVGPVGHPGDHTAGTLIKSGAVQFAVAEDVAAARVRCDGKLWEERHGYPSGVTRGRLVDIRWRPAVLRQVADRASSIEGYRAFSIEGFEQGERLTSTESKPRGSSSSWAFELTV